MTPNHRKDERGQVLVIVAGALLVIIALVGLVIDGGFAWGQQRQTQNAADAASEAGALQLAENVAGTSPANTDADVLAAVNASGQANGIGNPVAFYTNISGQMLTSTGGVTTNEAQAAQVGLVGTIPTGAAGVLARGSRTFDTFLMRAIGFAQLTTTANATAIAGYLTNTCAATAGCFILPVTVPVTIVSCDGSGNAVPEPGGPKYTTGVLYVLPLCKNGPGNVGWIDWTPTAGGTSELIDAINTPSNPYMKWPGWFFVTSTGNVNSKGVEDALRNYDGQPVSFPQFDGTCDATPTGPGLNGCPVGHEGGNGSNQWYHVAQMATFVFCGPAGVSNDADCQNHGPTIIHGAYVNGSDKPICDTGNGATSCIAGKFVVLSESGEVSAAPPPNPGTSKVGVQLIH